jgi:hypothetical protein
LLPRLAPRRLSVMLSAATRSRLLSTHRWVPIAPRWSRPPERKNAHRGLAGSCRAASRPTRPQVLIASGENSRRCTKAPRTPLLPQGNQNQDQLETVTVTAKQCTPASSNESFGDQVADAIVGFGDAFLIPILVRNALGIDGTVNYNSSAYTGGMIGGTIWGLAPFALEGAATYSAAQAARGTPSILNANPFFRIGPGRFGGNMVPRISSPYLPGDGHYSLTTRVPPIPPLGALASGNGC